MKKLSTQKLSKTEFELERNLFYYFNELKFQQTQMLDITKNNLKLAKKSNDEHAIKGWKIELKYVKNRLKFIDSKIGEYPIYIDSTYSDYLKYFN